MTLPFGTYAIAQLPAEYDLSVADPFAALLQDPEAQLIYLIELYPFNNTLEQTLSGIMPFGSGAFSHFNLTYYGGLSAVYLSDAGFITEPGDIPSSTYFIAQVDNPLQYETSILSGGDFGAGNQSFGSISIANGDGALDFLNQYFWSSRRVVIKAGSKDFVYSDFTVVFDGAANDIEADEERIVITIRDNRVKTEQLILPDFYAGTGGLEGGNDLSNKPKPLCYGVVNNIEPVLVDAANLIYQIHDGGISWVDKVRDSGVALANGGDVADITVASVPSGNFKTQLSGGYIKLGSTPSGRITADVHGESDNGGYVSTVTDIISRIVKTRLGAYSLGDSDIDLGSFNRLEIAIPGDVGIYINDRITAAAVIDDLINPLGAYWTFTRQGQLMVGFMDEPGTGTSTITDDLIDESGIKLLNTIPPAWRISVGYAPSFTVQKEDELAGATNDIDRAFVTEEYRYVTFEDSSILTQNRQAIDRVFKTKLADKADAEALLTRLTTIYTVTRRVYQVPAHRCLFLYYLGDTVKLMYNRFGLNAGADFIVVGTGEDAETGITALELWG
jgi:hypothetical protein